jgi:hypothetical protein
VAVAVAVASGVVELSALVVLAVAVQAVHKALLAVTAQ